MIVTDGTVVWIIDDIRDGTPVGAVRGSLYLPTGYVKANGATVQRSDYPRLVTLVDKHNLWTDDVTANAGLFGRGDSVATMVLPNWTDRMMQLAGDSAGATVAAGLPNITGEIDYTATQIQKVLKKSGAFAGTHASTGTVWAGSTSVETTAIDFDAARSNPIYGGSTTVQPSAIKLVPIIRY